MTGNEAVVSIKDGEFLEQPCACQVLKKDLCCGAIQLHRGMKIFLVFQHTLQVPS